MPRKTSSDKKSDLKSCMLQGTRLAADSECESIVNTYRKHLSEQPSFPVQVDLSDTTTLSASGISILLGLVRQCEKENRPLALTGVSDELKSLIKSLDLSETFTFSKAE